MAMITNKNNSTTPRSKAVAAVTSLEAAMEALAYCDNFLTDNTDTTVIEAAFDLAPGQGAAFKTLLQACNNQVKGSGSIAFVKQFVP